jgi:DNA-binding MarR family transcriptional regulator
MAEMVAEDSWKLPELLIRFMRATHELDRCEPEGQGLTAQQVRALVYLAHHDGATVKSLAEALSISEPRASRLSDELVDLGHLIRNRDGADRRQVRLNVAPQSAERARRMYRERAGAVQAALEGISEEEIRIATRVLERIVEEFEALVRPATEPRSIRRSGTVTAAAEGEVEWGRGATSSPAP